MYFPKNFIIASKCQNAYFILLIRGLFEEVPEFESRLPLPARTLLPCALRSTEIPLMPGHGAVDIKSVLGTDAIVRKIQALWVFLRDWMF